MIPPALAPQSAGITGVSYCIHTQHFPVILILASDFFFSFFLTESHSVAQAEVQWPGPSSLQLLLLGIQWFSLLSLRSSWDYKHAPSCPDSFCISTRDRVYHVGQAGLELLTSSDLASSVSQSAGIIGVSHRTQPSNPFSIYDLLNFSDFFNKYVLLSPWKENNFIYIYIYTHTHTHTHICVCLHVNNVVDTGRPACWD